MAGNGMPERGMVDAGRRDVDPARTRFELPGPWISGVDTAEVRDRKKIPGEALGADVNLGDGMVDDLFETVMSPRGFGVVRPTLLARQAPPPRHEDR